MAAPWLAQVVIDRCFAAFFACLVLQLASVGKTLAKDGGGAELPYHAIGGKHTSHSDRVFDPSSDRAAPTL